MSRWKRFAWALLFAGWGGCRTEHAPKGSPSSPVSVRLAAAHEEPLAVFYRAAGTVRGKSTAVLTAKVTGYLHTVSVRAGDDVKAGQVLAVIDAKGLAAALRRSEAGRENARQAHVEADHALRSAEVSLGLAEKEQARARALLAARAISAQAADETEAKLQGALSQREMARARRQAAEAREEEAAAAQAEAETAWSEARITAPFAGQVVERLLDPGNLATPGTPLLLLASRGDLRVEVTVEESRAALIHKGDRASVQVEAVGRSWEREDAVVTEIVPLVNAASRAFVVKVALAGDTGTLRPGMFARVAFSVGERARLVVPSTAVSGQGALDRVLVAEGDHLRLRMITCGEIQGGWTEVLSGVLAGERVVTAATGLGVVDGAPFVEAAGPTEQTGASARGPAVAGAR